ncbi:MAG: hypothetical protein HC828_02670 [Blastochloris sp.]|nr:hypothetical protein [Blastochloris sp.]
MQKENDYIILLNIFAHVLEANKGTPIEEKYLDGEGLASKCFFHASSLLYLLRSTQIPELGINFFDPASINVVARSALESFLVFHYVFAEPSTEDDKDFRYLSWKLVDLIERQKYEVLSPQAKAKQEQEREIIEDIKTRVTKNRYFKKLTSKQQKSLLGGKQWRIKSWTEIGLSAGLSKDNAVSFYRFLCSYAHAGNMSIVQLQQCETAEQQKRLCSATVYLTMITIAFFVKSYCQLFEKSKVFFEQNEEFSNIVKMWIQIGSTNLKDVDVDWEKQDF